MQDHTKGEVKLVRGSGPPILTVEGEVIGVSDQLYALSMNRWRPQCPLVAHVIGIDLTRRSVRLQVTNGREIVYTADNSNRNQETYFLFSTAEQARRNAVRCCDDAIKAAVEKADQSLAELEEAKAKRLAVERWAGVADDGVNDDS